MIKINFHLQIQILRDLKDSLVNVYCNSQHIAPNILTPFPFYVLDTCILYNMKFSKQHLVYQIINNISSAKWSDPGHFSKSQGKIFLSFLYTLFLYF